MTARVLALIAVATMACETPSACPRAPQAAPVPLTQVTLDGAELTIPVGWDVRARAAVEPTFDVASRDGELVVVVSMVRSIEPDVSLRHALQRLLDEASAPAELRMNSQREGWWYDEAVTESGRLIAACAVDYEKDIAVLAVAHGATVHSISRQRYERAGGREMLCGIAASVRFTE